MATLRRHGGRLECKWALGRPIGGRQRRRPMKKKTLYELGDVFLLFLSIKMWTSLFFFGFRVATSSLHWPPFFFDGATKKRKREANFFLYFILLLLFYFFFLFRRERKWRKKEPGRIEWTMMLGQFTGWHRRPGRCQPKDRRRKRRSSQSPAKMTALLVRVSPFVLQRNCLHFFFRVTNVHGRPNHHPEISHFITQPNLT